MINSKTLIEFIKSVFDKDKIPDKEGIHILMEDNLIWTIKLYEKINKNIEIKVNDILLGQFQENDEIGKNLYVCTFLKNNKNCRKHPQYYEVIKCRFEEFNIFTTKL